MSEPEALDEIVIPGDRDCVLDGNSLWVTVARQKSDHPHSGEKMSVHIYCDSQGFIRIGLYKHLDETEEPIAEIVN